MRTAMHFIVVLCFENFLLINLESTECFFLLESKLDLTKFIYKSLVFPVPRPTLFFCPVIRNKLFSFLPYLCIDSFIQVNSLSLLRVDGQDLVVNFLVEGDRASVVKHRQQVVLKWGREKNRKMNGSFEAWQYQYISYIWNKGTNLKFLNVRWVMHTHTHTSTHS